MANILRDACSGTKSKQDNREIVRTLLERAKYSASSSAVLLNNGIIPGSLNDFEHSVKDSVVAYLSFTGIITKEKAKSYLEGGYSLEAISNDTKLVSDFYARHHGYLSNGESGNGSGFDSEGIAAIVEMYHQESTGTAQTLKVLQRTLENPLEVRPLIIAFAPVKRIDPEDQERIASIFKYDREKGRSLLEGSRNLPYLFVAASVLFTYRLQYSETDPIPEGLVQTMPELLKHFNRGIVGFEALLALEYQMSTRDHFLS